MSYMIQDVTCDNFNFYGRTKQRALKKSFLPSAFFSHRHIKSDMLKSITREFLNFIFTFFFFLCILKENLQKNKKKSYSEIRDFCYSFLQKVKRMRDSKSLQYKKMKNKNTYEIFIQHYVQRTFVNIRKSA